MKMKLQLVALITTVGLLFAAGSAGAQVPPDEGDDATTPEEESFVILEEVDDFGVPLAAVQLGGATVILPLETAAAVCDVTIGSLRDQLDDEGSASCVPAIDSTGSNAAGVTSAATDTDIIVSLQIEGSTIQVPLTLAADLCDRDIATLRQDLNGGDVTCRAASAIITTTGGSTPAP